MDKIAAKDFSVLVQLSPTGIKMKSQSAMKGPYFPLALGNHANTSHLPMNLVVPSLARQIGSTLDPQRDGVT